MSAPPMSDFAGIDHHLPMNKPVLWIRPEPTPEDETLLDALASRGFSLAVVGAKEAVSGLYRRQDVSALVVDARLIDAACRLRDGSPGTGESHLPVLVLSRGSDIQTRLSALRRGADAFFSPPLSADEVAAKLAQLLGVAADARPCKVVVVDDDPSQADFAATILSKAGIEVRTVTQSLETLDTLRDFRPELILMDVYMPDASGLELTAIIREQKDLMDIPIVYLSGEHDPDKQLDALSVGGEDFLTKPIRPKHLIATVRNRIDRSRQLRQGISEHRRQEGDPALVRKHILEQLEILHDSPAAAGKATGLLYVEIDSALLLLEQVNLDGIDEVMSSIMRLSRQVARSADRIARFGDFCLVLTARRERQEQLRELAQRIKAAVAGFRFSAAENRVNTTVSIGIRLLEDSDGNVPNLIGDAIRACHQAREKGRGGILIHRGARPAERKKAGVQDGDLLERITDRDNLQLVYQPVVPLQRAQGALYQCLLQLHAEDGRILPAREFLPAVEQTGKILKLDRWVIIKALMTLHKLYQKHTRPPRLMISQSASALKDLKRVPWLHEKLAKTRIKGRALVLEFPFPGITADPQGARDYLASLQQLGIGVSLNCTGGLDDLLQELNLLPADYVKITENQIRNYPDTWGPLVEAAHKLNKRIIVSRVEHPELLGQLWSSDVDYIQGYFVQPPGRELNYDFTGAILI